MSNYSINGMNVRIDRQQDGTMLCPRCGDDYMHHCGVAVFDGTDDATAKTHLAGSAPFPEDGNPSRRGDAVSIRFTCEMCGPEVSFDLHVIQHKGRTFLEWVEAEV